MSVKDSLRVSVVQMSSQDNVAQNLADAEALMLAAIESDQPDLLSLPEHFHWSGGTPEQRRASATQMPGGEIYERMQNFAKRHNVWLHAGSMYEEIPGETRVYNTSVVFNRQGQEVARYRKIHMFDITAPDGSVYRESAANKPGDQAVVFDLEGFKIGCAICYDLRFPSLFQELSGAGAEVLLLPASFTLMTGKDHWEVLLRARAIENAAYVVAAGQCGTFPHSDGSRRHTWGHSLIADPWGHVVAKASDGPGFASHTLKKANLAEVRGRIPVLEHRTPIRPVATTA